MWCVVDDDTYLELISCLCYKYQKERTESVSSKKTQTCSQIYKNVLTFGNLNA